MHSVADSYSRGSVAEGVGDGRKCVKLGKFKGYAFTQLETLQTRWLGPRQGIAFKETGMSMPLFVAIISDGLR
jgi:hypothetical protein